MDRNQTMPNSGVRKSYENNYTKTYDGNNTWRGAQDGNGNVERYGQKQPVPRFQGTNPQYNGHQTEIVQNGVDGKPVRQQRPNNYQNRPNGTFVPRNSNPAGNNGHQGQYVHQGVNPAANGYQGNRGKPEVSVFIQYYVLKTHVKIFFFLFNSCNSFRDFIKIAIKTIDIQVVQQCQLVTIIIVIHIRSNQMEVA